MNEIEEDNGRDISDTELGRDLKNMLDNSENEEEVCELCGGKNGEHEQIDRMESVYSGEPHQASVGTRPCPNFVMF